MSEPSRRDILLTLAALGVSKPSLAATSEPRLVHSAIFPYDALATHDSPNGMVGRSVIHGTLATGEVIEVHETTLPAGEMPHPPHRHTHSEFIMVREGTLEILSDGQRGTLTSGGVTFTASGVLHSLKNVGVIPANYFVVAVGLQRAMA